MHSTNNSLTPSVSESDHHLGNMNAPVQLVEFGDYQCPYCGQAQTVVEQVRQAAGSSLVYVFRNFPLPMHQYAMPAAEAAEAAAAQGKFWEMHKLLYQNQDRLAPSDLLQYAQQLGLNMDRFRHDLDTHAGRRKIERDVQSGEESGVPGTPTFFVNGRIYQGPVDAEALLDVSKSAQGR